LLLSLLFAIGTAAVEYGDIPHNTLAQNPRYKRAQTDSAAVAGREYSSLLHTCQISAAACKRLPD
jgi:hypothetical protein